jgi:DtxR family Mn-dependent transcriptional regulator
MKEEQPMTADDRQHITPVIEDYLKVIYTVQQEQAPGPVRTSVVAEQLDVTSASVTAMLKTLADLKLVTYAPYRGVILTPAGERIALEVVRHHRLIELYLVEALGYSWDEVHQEAEALEHVISEKLEARIAAHLSYPTVDPHGEIIPALDGTLPQRSTQRLADLAVGAEARIAQVSDQDAEQLRYLAELGLVPGAQVQITASAPFDGPLSLRIGTTTQVLDRRLARTILVEE